MKKQPFHSKLISLFSLFIFMLISAACGPQPIKSLGNNIELTSLTATSPLSYSVGAAKHTNKGELVISLRNISNETLDVDIWADVVSGILFTTNPGDPSRQASLSGVTMRSGETRVIKFSYWADPQAIVGEYIIDIHLSAPTKEDQLITSTRITVTE